MTDDYIRRASVVRVLDGDTFEMRVDLGYRVEGRFLIRLRGFDAAELPTEEGWEAHRKASKLFEQARVITVKSYKDRMTFARWVADVWVDGVSLAELMVQP